MTTVSATEVPMEEMKFADTRCELAGSTRTKSCDLNLGSWVIAPADEHSEYPVINYWVSLTVDFSEYKIFRFVTRADALTWVEETCGQVNWVEMGA